MKFKKIASLALAATMLASAVPGFAASAAIDVTAVTLDNTGNVSGWSAAGDNVANGYDGSLWGTTSQYAHSGKYALLFSNGYKTTWQQHWKECTGDSLVAGENYTVEVWSKNEHIDGFFFGSMKNGIFQKELNFSEAMTETERKDGWIKYTGTFAAKGTTLRLEAVKTL